MAGTSDIQLAGEREHRKHADDDKSTGGHNA